MEYSFNQRSNLCLCKLDFLFRIPRRNSDEWNHSFYHYVGFSLSYSADSIDASMFYGILSIMSKSILSNGPATYYLRSKFHANYPTRAVYFSEGYVYINHSQPNNHDQLYHEGAYPYVELFILTSSDIPFASLFI